MPQFLPSFFNKDDKNEQISQEESTSDQTEIPINFLDSSHPKVIEDSVTIFGFTKQNLPILLNEIEKYKPQTIEYNSNYIVLKTDTQNLKSLLKLNRTKLNGEIIGVYRNNLIGELEDDIFEDEGMKREGVFKKFFKLFF